MQRRELLAVFGGMAAWPIMARAQQSERMRRIGVLMAHADTDPEYRDYLAAFWEELHKLGWTEGRNIQVDTRWGALDDPEVRLRSANELIALQPDLIISQNTPPTETLLQQTHSIPVVFVIVADPVGSGFVKNLARATAAPIHDISDLEAIFAAEARNPKSGVIIMPDGFMNVHRAEVVALAARYRVPTVYPWRYFTELGGLMSYGNEQRDSFRLAATYADRILKGEKPSDLPVQAPVKFDLIINMKAAEALGLDVPLRLQQLADRIIE